jgi:hypothetical protein
MPSYKRAEYDGIFFHMPAAQMPSKAPCSARNGSQRAHEAVGEGVQSPKGSQAQPRRGLRIRFANQRRRVAVMGPRTSSFAKRSRPLPQTFNIRARGRRPDLDRALDTKANDNITRLHDSTHIALPPRVVKLPRCCRAPLVFAMVASSRETVT